MASRLSIYTEELGERPDLVEMRKKLQSAKNIVFLGFGFHKQNMDLLAPDDGPTLSPLVLATACQEPAPRRDAISARIMKAFGTKDMHLGYAHQTSPDFLKDFGVLVSA